MSSCGDGNINKTYIVQTNFLSGATIDTNDYTITSQLSGNTLYFTRLSGGTYSVDLSSITVTGATGGNTDDYTTSAQLSGNTLLFTRLSGDTYSVDLSSITVTGATGGNTDDYTVEASFSGSVIQFTRLSGGTYTVDISGITETIYGPVIFDIETTGSTTTYIGYGEPTACKIRRVITTSGSTYVATWAGGTEDLDKIWADRYTYSYF